MWPLSLIGVVLRKLAANEETAKELRELIASGEANLPIPRTETRVVHPHGLEGPAQVVTRNADGTVTKSSLF